MQGCARAQEDPASSRLTCARAWLGVCTNRKCWQPHPLTLGNGWEAVWLKCLKDSVQCLTTKQAGQDSLGLYRVGSRVSQKGH